VSSVTRRHALVLGFGIGALAVIALGALAGSFVFKPQAPQTRTAAIATSPPPSPSASPVSSPVTTRATPASGGAMVYDPENHGVILFGGSEVIHEPDGTNLGRAVADTWLWDGKAWKQLDVSGPPARGAEMAAYDSLHHQIVLFGGAGPAGIGQAQLFQDTWTWDGARWQEQHPAHIPNPRMRAAMAFDEQRGVVVMFGGEGEGTTTYNATWTWDGTDWTLQKPATSPPGRHFATMAYDAARGDTVLFGGSMAGARFNDTWTWDGSNWTEQSGHAPTARGWSTLAYDAATRQVVAYVYFGLDNNPVVEYTITWDGTGWTDRTSPGDPSPRAETRMAYDPETQQVVLFGGSYVSPSPFSETWTWDGQKWSLWDMAGAA
jgi:galactose oxidase-like protein